MGKGRGRGRGIASNVKFSWNLIFCIFNIVSFIDVDCRAGGGMKGV